jgi:hypothetical protein
MSRCVSVIGRCLFGLCCAGILVGCGEEIDPGYKPVSGTVLLDGQPLADAVISFTPEDGSTASGRTDENGVYTLYYAARRPGARVGPNTVEITKEAAPAGGGDEFAVMTEEEGELLPPRYNTQTELTATVENTGDNTIDFQLTSE